MGNYKRGNQDEWQVAEIKDKLSIKQRNTDKPKKRQTRILSQTDANTSRQRKTQNIIKRDTQTHIVLGTGEGRE